MEQKRSGTAEIPPVPRQNTHFHIPLENFVMKLRRFRTREKTQQTGIFRILAPSVAAIILCGLCLCGTSWAWFTVSHTSGVATIETAAYTLALSASDGETTHILSPLALSGGKTYAITLTADATASTGYGRLQLGSEVYYTPQITKGASFCFTVKANEDGLLTVTAQWGTHAGSENVLEENAVLTFGTASDESTEDTTEGAAADEPAENGAVTDEIAAVQPTQAFTAEETTAAPETAEPTEPEGATVDEQAATPAADLIPDAASGEG